MNRPESRTSAIRSFSSSSSGAYCAFTSTSGIRGTAAQSRRPSPAHEPGNRESHDEEDDRDVDVTEIAVEAAVARPERPSQAGNGEAEHRASQRGQRCEPTEAHAGDAGRNGDERAHEGRREPERDRSRAEVVEPALGPFELRLADMEKRSVAVEEGPATRGADRPAERGSDGVPRDPGERHRNVGPPAVRQRVAE